MLSDESKKWLEDHGVVVGEDGLPLPVVVPGPPQLCLRCKGLTEYGGSAMLCGGGATYEGVVCNECRAIGFADSRAYWSGFDWEWLKTR